MSGEAEASKRPKLPVAELVPWAVFLLLILGAGAWYWQEQRVAAQQRAQRSVEAAKLGLPSDFPLEFVPVEPSIVVDKVEMGEATSKDNEPMQHWTVSGHSDADYKAIHEFYRQHFTGLGWMQTQMISIPTGQSADYANESIVVHLEIERPKSREDTSFKMDVYRVVGQ